MTSVATNSYLTFSLGEEKFAVPVDCVQEVVELEQVTKVPHAPEYMLGIINLRGKVLPLLDTRLKLGLSKTVPTRKSRVLVINLGWEEKHFQLGALVDTAREVVEFTAGDIHSAQQIENYKAGAPITGFVNRQGDITLIMEASRIFTTADIIQLEHSAHINHSMHS